MEAVDPDTIAWLEALRTRSYKNARQLLRSDQDVNVRGPGGNTALHLLAADGYEWTPKIRKLLLDDADISLTNDRGQTPLRLAQLHNTDVVALLIEHEELLRALTVRLARTPTTADIYSALRNNRMRVFRNAVRRRVESQTQRLIQAARVGDLATVRAMVERREINVDTVDKAHNDTAFSVALANNHRHVCDFLLENDVHLYNWCRVDGAQKSILQTAVLTGDVVFVRRLVAHGDLLAIPTYDHRPLEEAIKMGNKDMLDALLEMGARASPHIAGYEIPWPVRHVFWFEPDDADEQTPFWLLTMACWYRDLRVIQHLFATHSTLHDREKMETRGASALFIAVYHKNEAMVLDLLARGVAVNQPIDQGHTAVVAAVAAHSVAMLHLLMDRGANTNILHNAESSRVERWSLLTVAVALRAIECVRVLLPLDTRPRLRDQALILAVERSDQTLVPLLLDDALPSSKDAFQRCLHRARCPIVMDLLLSRCCASETLSVRTVEEVLGDICHNSDVVSVLLAHGVDVNYNRFSAYTSPLMKALLSRRDNGADVARTLIDNGVDNVHWFLYSSQTPLSMVERQLEITTYPPFRAQLEASRDLLLQVMGSTGRESESCFEKE